MTSYTPAEEELSPALTAIREHLTAKNYPQLDDTFEIFMLAETNREALNSLAPEAFPLTRAILAYPDLLESLEVATVLQTLTQETVYFFAEVHSA